MYSCLAEPFGQDLLYFLNELRLVLSPLGSSQSNVFIDLGLQIEQGEIFQEPYPMLIWVTDDRNKAPVLVKSTVIVGSVKIELIEVEGLKYPLESLTD